MEVRSFPIPRVSTMYDTMVFDKAHNGRKRSILSLGIDN